MMHKIKTHIIEIFACMFLLLFIFWSVGYWANALFNMKFDLQSCWAGFALLTGPGLLAVLKYITDSWLNTNKGEKPL